MRGINSLISVGMPVRNNSSVSPYAIQSIRWQTYLHWELRVFDDGSTDGAAEIAYRYAQLDQRIRVFSDGRHLEMAYRLNQAISISRGHLFAWMDGDDVAYPHRFERLVEYLCLHPEVDLNGAAAIVFWSRRCSHR
jgi:glycosyltransferase involved in cell wall biosynthesis